MKKFSVVLLLLASCSGNSKPVEVICAGCKLAEVTICAIQQAMAEAKPCPPPQQKVVVNMNDLFSEHPEMPKVECR